MISDKTMNFKVERDKDIKAKELLKNTSLSIGEVCIESGFESHSYFSMLFKRSNGCTPGEYRSAESRGKRE